MTSPDSDMAYFSIITIVFCNFGDLNTNQHLSFSEQVLLNL